MTGPPVYLCRACRRLLPRDDDHFYRRRDRPDVPFINTCKECTREANRARREQRVATPEGRDHERAMQRRRQRRHRLEHPGADAVKSKAYRERMREQDAERWKVVKQDARITAKLHKDNGAAMPVRATATVGAYVPLPPPTHGNHVAPLLDVGPIRAWLASEFRAMELYEIARRCRVHEATVRRILSGEQRRVSLHIADRMFVGADCPHLLAVLYPVEVEVAA